MKEIKRTGGKPLPVTVQDIVDALERGDEAIDISKCSVSYDHALVAEMARRHERWAPCAKGKAERGAPGTSKSKGKGKRKQCRVAKAPTHHSSLEASSDAAFRQSQTTEALICSGGCGDAGSAPETTKKRSRSR
ncbi:hypothetical protein DFH08DRAFT_826272 [Mycena albidolilacea]|uniref:Uncharacterized protein n=1 Tax=Mycena albidolilacea TaxID=1033008 RepID=A0AAD6Z0R6_9AGAR|nr:hypothetical protein DFH08DRAFT_826272 [Mycena albidolilacea]